MKVTHLCAIKKQHSHTYLPRLPVDASWRQRFIRRFYQWTLVYDKHPKCIEYFKNVTGLHRERKRHVQSFLYIIHPFSKFRVYYEIYMCLVYLFSMFVLMSDLSFYDNIEANDVIYEFVCLLGTIDIIMTFFTGYATSTRETVLEPKKIAKRYVCSMFLIFDILAFIPVRFVIWIFFEEKRFSAELVIDVLRLVIIFRLDTLISYMTNTAEYFGVKSEKIFIILRYTIAIFILVSYFGALSFQIPRLDMLVKRNIHRSSWLRQAHFLTDAPGRYFKTLFRTSGHLLGTSLGAYNISRWEELSLAIIVFIFGRFYTILLTVQILHIMAQSRMLATKYRRIINQLEQYMTYKDLPNSMRKRLRMYYDYKYQKKFFREEVITSVLSDGLKREIKMHDCRKLVSNVTLFAGLSTQTVNEIIEYLRHEVYLPNDPIIKAGDPADCMYLISTGTVAVYTPSGKELCHLQDGAYFGEVALILKNQLRSANVTAVEICEVYSLARSHFKKYFMSNQQLYQKLYQKAEDRYEMLLMVEEMYKKK